MTTPISPGILELSWSGRAADCLTPFQMPQQQWLHYYVASWLPRTKQDTPPLFLRITH